MSNSSGINLPYPSPNILPAIVGCNELPLLDVGDYLAGKPGAMEQLAADIRAVHENLGFMAIVNHGVSQSVIDEAYEQVRKAFLLPPEELKKYTKQDHMQGYWPPSSIRNVRPGYENEKTHHSTVTGWLFLRDREPDDPKVVNNIRHRAMNKWPDPAVLPEFKKALKFYQSSMLNLGYRLLRVYSLALGQEPDYLEKDFADPEWYNRLNYYSGNPMQEYEIGLSAHSDHSFITLLPMSPTPGLQVRTPRGDWIDAPHVPGAIIINGGEWLNQISNGKFLATPHRVTEPPSERISMPFFFDPGDEAVNDPVPGSVKEGEERKFPRRKWYDHFISYIDGYTKS